MAAASQLSSSIRVSPTRVALRSTAVKRVAAKAPVRGLVRAEAAPEFAGLGPEMKTAVDKFLGDNKIVVFMKGDKEAPRCGFSSKVVAALKKPQTAILVLGGGYGAVRFFQWTIETMSGVNDPMTMTY